MKKGVVFTIVMLVTSSLMYANGKLNTYSGQSKDFERVTKKHDRVIIDFSAHWCPPCKKMVPNLEKIAQQYPAVHVIKVNYDDYKDLFKEYGIGPIPTLLFFENNAQVGKTVGLKSVEDIAGLIEKYFS